MFTSRMEDQEVMDQQRMLNEEAIQEEQRRILEKILKGSKQGSKGWKLSRKLLILRWKETRIQTSSGELVLKLSQDSILEF